MICLDPADLLAEGGSSRIYKVRAADGRFHALKVTPKNSIRRGMTWREPGLHKTLQHPHIVTWEDSFEDAENYYLLLEYCENTTVLDVVQTTGKLSEAVSIATIRPVVDACLYLHERRIIHRDIKPANFFLAQHMAVKLGDFGFAIQLEPGQDNVTMDFGTVNYVAPEILQRRPYAFAVDSWSLGVAWFEMLHAQAPFAAPTVAQTYQRIKDNDYQFLPNTHVSDTLKLLIRQLLAADPKLRPTMHQLRQHPIFQ